MNLIYPFVEREDDSFKKEVAHIKKCFTLCGVNKFDMKFNSDSVGFFEHTATFNLFLKPFPVDSSDVIADCDVGSRNQVVQNCYINQEVVSKPAEVSTSRTYVSVIY